MTSSRAVSGFMATRKSISFLRPMYPCLLARIVNQVGSPAMFDGNMFLPETGMPIWKMDAHQDGIGGLAAGTVDGCDLNAEIVDDGLLQLACEWRGGGNLNSGHLLSSTSTWRRHCVGADSGIYLENTRKRAPESPQRSHRHVTFT